MTISTVGVEIRNPFRFGNEYEVIGHEGVNLDCGATKGQPTGNNADNDDDDNDDNDDNDNDDDTDNDKDHIYKNNHMQRHGRELLVSDRDSEMPRGGLLGGKE